jgi:hypothetical protein
MNVWHYPFSTAFWARLAVVFPSDCMNYSIANLQAKEEIGGQALIREDLAGEKMQSATLYTCLFSISRYFWNGLYCTSDRCATIWMSFYLH